MVIPPLARLGVLLASATTVVAVALVPGMASAQTQACGNTPGTAASFCTGLHTAQGAPMEVCEGTYGHHRCLP